MKYILILYLSGGTPTSVEFDTAFACMTAGASITQSIDMHTGKDDKTPWMLCEPKGGTAKDYEKFYSPVVEFNKP